MQHDAPSSTALNECTVVAQWTMQFGGLPLVARFAQVFGLLRATCASVATGWVVASSGPGGPRATLMRRTHQAIFTLVVRRHRQADLVLPGDPTVSLRHMVLLVRDGAGAATAPLRALDLNTPWGFSDEQGQRHRSVQADGPVVLSCGGHLLFIIPAQIAAQWGTDAAEAWAALPPRVVRPATLHAAEAVASGGAPVTRVRTLPRPLQAGQLARIPVGDHAGVLSVSSPQGTLQLPLNEKALRRGVLLGRYDRCHPGARDVLCSEAISRVHLLLIRHDGQLWAVDTSSTNGICLASGEPTAVAPLETGGSALLGQDLAEVTWRGSRWSTGGPPA